VRSQLRRYVLQFLDGLDVVAQFKPALGCQKVKGIGRLQGFHRSLEWQRR
jgi:hypothetical protein